MMQEVAVLGVGEAVAESPELDVGDVAQAQYLAVGECLDDDVAELLGVLQAAGEAHGVLEALVALLAEGAGCRLDVLLCHDGGDVAGHQAVLGHHLWLEPDAHGVVGAEAHGVADAVDALYLRHDVD